jgi:hypothetical protein
LKLEIMTEEPGTSKPVSPEKLLIDDPSNFLFHAAYVAYSEAFDNSADPEGRKQLNESIVALQQNQIDCSTFYRNISNYRSEGGSAPRTFGRLMIKTQRKRDWRRQTQKHERIQRHKK